MSRPPRSELLALLADVKANPDDLTPWLVLTDWLEENGDEADRARAEYCRLCFDKFGKKTYASHWEKGERRRELFRDYRDQWFGRHFGFVEVKRGLLQIISSADQLLQAVDAGMPSELPAWVERLVVSDLTSDLVVRLATCPLLEGPVVVWLNLVWNEEPRSDAI